MIPKKPERKEHCDFCTQNHSFMSEYPQCNCSAFEHNLLVGLTEKREKWFIETLEKIRFKDYDIKALIMFCKQHIFLPENDNFQILDDLLNGATDKFLSHLQDKEVVK